MLAGIALISQVDDNRILGEALNERPRAVLREEFIEASCTAPAHKLVQHFVAHRAVHPGQPRAQRSQGRIDKLQRCKVAAEQQHTFTLIQCLDEIFLSFELNRVTNDPFRTKPSHCHFRNRGTHGLKMVIAEGFPFLRREFWETHLQIFRGYPPLFRDEEAKKPTHLLADEDLQA